MKFLMTSAAAGILFALVATGTRAEDPTARTFTDTYIHACQPVEFDFAGVTQPLDAAAARVHEEVFLDTYLGSCRDFYFAEVVPRLDPALRPRSLGPKMVAAR